MTNNIQTKTYPNFLGIGAQKAGTSWLHECLRQHPGIWLPPEKEIHYFDRSPEYSSPSFLHPDQPILRLIGNGHWNKVFRSRIRGVWKDNRHNRDVLKWYYKYFLVACGDDWYASLFEEGRDKIRGEITPAYSILDEKDVKHAGRLMPDGKIIFILRNPVDRAWSQFRFMVRLGEFSREMQFDEFKNWVDSADQERRSDYLKTLSLWHSVFRRENVFIGFYDDIVAQPRVLLREILTFLGADADDTTIGGIIKEERVNVSPEIEIPAKFQQYLLDKYRDDLKRMADELGGPASNWLEKACV